MFRIIRLYIGVLVIIQAERLVETTRPIASISTLTRRAARSEPREEVKVRINTVLKNEPAEVLVQLKQRGLARSNTDAISQALLAFYEKVLDRDLKISQLRNLGRGEE